MLDLNSLLSRGYFPRELPPPFYTEKYSQVINNSLSALPNSFSNARRRAKVSSHSVARINIRRRRLSVPNPVLFFNLSKCIVDHWTQITTHTQFSSLSKSLPVFSKDHGRAILPEFTHDDLLPIRARIRSTSKYILVSDISRFYPSIYTHSIPWALHTKPIAKANPTNYSYYGNSIDRWIRNGQDGQTIGVPIGPDTSLAIAETLLSSVDRELSSKLPNTRGFRYIDDYEFGVTSYSEAEEVFAILQSVLKEYELELNLDKTRILELPKPLESHWVPLLRNFVFRSNPSAQMNDLIHYFDLAYRFAYEYPDDHVLKYAIQRLRVVQVDHKNWGFTQDFLHQSLTNETGTFIVVLAQLIDRDKDGYSIDLDTLSQIVNYQICTQCSIDHGSEVAWAIWAAIYWGIKINKSSAESLSLFNDSIVALLALDAKQQKLITDGLNTDLWESYMLSDELYGEQWLLSYEANVKGWLSSSQSTDHVNDDQNFKFLKDNDVEFYDTNRIKLAVPTGASLLNGFYPIFGFSEKDRKP